jgi:hypothetical protein
MVANGADGGGNSGTVFVDADSAAISNTFQ